MKFSNVSCKEVRKANRLVYDKKDIREYEQNPSIFEPSRQEQIKALLAGISRKTGGDKLLDIGCGTGNVLKLGKDYFRFVIGMDSSINLLRQVKERNPELNLVVADADYLPFKKNAFDCVTLYGTLHHLFDPVMTLGKATPLLKANGFLYTDHDPNYFFNRFYHLYYRLRYHGKAGFGTPQEEIAEFHNTQTSGINPELIKNKLRAAGLNEVEIHYRHTTNQGLSLLSRFFLVLLKIFSYVIPLRSFYTHFYLIARK
ncbi:MAG: methyltransferase domain-containing protein [Planctomycetes bacterium]|nr:methyltransferase domain-containing protein [Planctomycetota bacterium]